ncbi:hypothetical protein [Pseudomonas sp. KNUC1026]|uniref:hypothetical protein n=1 Tax=Pseudomonas sp. KNUC1026 TaxID=2893890 RepID=UPI001F253B64|nr:hypothetical protein [Pseudomonas sp. KNUC1026]UFH48579.1 hypothetical protein LN139_16000 [Pseudomonas sp. KNUC1026]
MYRKLLKILLLSLPLAGCAYDPAYDSPAVYTSSTVYTTGVYSTPPTYYGGAYYVRPAPRYYVPPPVYTGRPPSTTGLRRGTTGRHLHRRQTGAAQVAHALAGARRVAQVGVAARHRVARVGTAARHRRAARVGTVAPRRLAGAEFQGGF